VDPFGMADTTDMLVAKGLHKSFGKGRSQVHVLRGLDLRVRRGEFLAVMGPSGCGKSTLLHVMGLMTPPDAGELVLDGRPVGAREAERTRLRRHHIGFVFQRFNLISVLSARDNAAISLHVRGLACDGHIDELLAAMGVAHVAGRKPGEMSIGEQQRVAVARALAHSPALLLADEPTGNLDSDNSRALLELLRSINRERGQTLVMITHSAEAAECADHVARMKDGRIVDP
jgi:putative ABC transport system ATP-binding protein